MAKSATVGMDPEYRTVLSRPGMFLVHMLVFLLLAGFIVAILGQQVLVAFKSNPGLNAVIIGVLVIGIFYMIRQVTRLYPEIRWVNSFRITDPGLAIDVQPTLLAPMATMLRDRRGALSLSHTAMRVLMDSLASRLDESRDTARYLIGLLVFLGLLGTFWGLLETISSVGKTISSLDARGGDSVNLFEELKSGLSEPLRGMGTAFSASLFGLAGSLVLGFLDLQVGKAHNRFYNELEEWLSQITELTPRTGVEATGADLRQTLYELQRTIEALTGSLRASGAQPPGAVGGQVPLLPPPPAGPDAARAMQDLALQLDQVVKQMRTEQKVVREWIDDQAAQQADIAQLLRDLSGALGRSRS